MNARKTQFFIISNNYYINIKQNKFKKNMNEM